MKGLSTTALNVVKLGSYVIETTSTAISGRKLTGTFKRIWSESDTETRKKGISVAGKIGVFYYNKKEEQTKTSIGEAKVGTKAQPAADSKKGIKKTWTGPSVTHEGNTVTAGGYTHWSKYVYASDAVNLTNWLCQTATFTTPIKDQEAAQVWLQDKTSATNTTF